MISPAASRVPTVLIVEDEPLIRLLAVHMVEDAGLEAVECSNATDAETILETRADIRIVFTDIDMPNGVNGMLLAAAIRDRWPPIHLIVTSGHHLERDTVLPQGAFVLPQALPGGGGLGCHAGPPLRRVTDDVSSGRSVGSDDRTSTTLAQRLIPEDPWPRPRSC